MALHNCGECRHLVRTHPEQVFLKCRFWCGSMHYTLKAAQVLGRDYAVTHCHMQPWAEACPFFERRKVMMHADATPFRAAAASA